jgi:predicted aconitase
MQLTDREKEMLDGKDGEAVRIAMSILSDIGDAVEAEEMTEIVHVHTDSGFYLGDAGLEFVEHLAGKVCVPTTMNNTSFDHEGFRLLKTGLHAVIDGSKGEIVLAGI